CIVTLATKGAQAVDQSQEFAIIWGVVCLSWSQFLGFISNGSNPFRVSCPTHPPMAFFDQSVCRITGRSGFNMCKAGWSDSLIFMVSNFFLCSSVHARGWFFVGAPFSMLVREAASSAYPWVNLRKVFPNPRKEWSSCMSLGSGHSCIALTLWGLI